MAVDIRRRASAGRNPACITGALLLGLALLLSSGSALAHRLQVFASADGDWIQGKVYFVGGHPARGVEVGLLDAEGGRVAELRTDHEGRFRFQAPAVTDYRVVARSADGHRAEWPIAASELHGAFDETRPTAAGVDSARSNPVALGPPGGFDRTGATGDKEGQDAGYGASTASCLPIDAELERALSALIQQEIQQGIEPGLARSVEQAVARQVAPLREALAEAQAQASFRDLLGGLGYIAGLAGFGLWWTRRRQQRQSGTDSADD